MVGLAGSLKEWKVCRYLNDRTYRPLLKIRVIITHPRDILTSFNFVMSWLDT